MTTATKIKITPGSEYVLSVESVEKVTGQYGDQYQITAVDGYTAVVLYEKCQAVERQAARLGTTPDGLIGGTWKFSKTPMQNDPTKGFLNIDKVATGAQPRPVPRPSAAPTGGEVAPAWMQEQGAHEAQTVAAIKASAPDAEWESLAQLYGRCVRLAGDIARDADLTAAEVPAMAATLFIEANKRGIGRRAA